MKIQNVRPFGLLLFCMLGAGCTTISPVTPEWALLPERNYPPARYFSVFGQSHGLYFAKKEATANLNRLFDLQMKEAQQITMQAYQQLGFPSTFQPVFTETMKPVPPLPPKSPRPHFGNHYIDTTGTTHVLAVLDRAEVAKPFAEQMEAGAVRVREHLSRANAARTPFQRFAELRTALLCVLQNEMPAARISVLYPMAMESFRPGYTTTNILSRAAAAAAAVTFTVSVQGDSDGTVSAAVQDTLKGLGFVPARKGVLHVTGDLQTSLSKNKDGKTARTGYRLTLQVSDQGGSRLASVKADHVEHFPLIEARGLAARSLNKAIHSTLREQMIAAINRTANVTD